MAASPTRTATRITWNSPESIGAVAIFNEAKPRLEMGTGTTPLQQLEDTNQIYFFSLRMDNDDKYRFLRAEDFDIWHRRMGDISSRCLEILSKEDGNCLSFLMKMGRHATCCAIGENAQQAHPKKATYDAGPPVLLTFSDLMRSITPEALGGYIYACKGTVSAKRRRGINLLKNKNDAVASLKTIQSGGRNPVDRASSAFAQTRAGGYSSQELLAGKLWRPRAESESHTTTPPQPHP